MESGQIKKVQKNLIRVMIGQNMNKSEDRIEQENKSFLMVSLKL